MTEKDEAQKDNKPKNQLVEGMRRSKGTGVSPDLSYQHSQERVDIKRPGSSLEGADDYQVGGLRWPD